jgi:hypothetical protein
VAQTSWRGAGTSRSGSDGTRTRDLRRDRAGLSHKKPQCLVRSRPHWSPFPFQARGQVFTERRLHTTVPELSRTWWTLGTPRACHIAVGAIPDPVTGRRDSRLRPPAKRPAPASTLCPRWRSRAARRRASDSRIERVTRFPLDPPANSAVVLTNPDEDSSPAAFGACGLCLSLPRFGWELDHAADSLISVL